MLEREAYEVNELDQKIHLMMGVSCGNEGIIPCHKGCYHNCCINDSGDVLCEGYIEHFEVTETITGNKVYIVRCQNAVDYNL